ncbi:hypothetical protein W97_09210 [Coniosporium apollinis CBS 100218]|uniref:PLL-like beta propeller domain-containing protein n=1 Tax=Coniosporium apollinis (strain CBS 100218) TaxID=1168221 RepID=R7Z6X9_CONA1|nr:uncharacterized protein W97_09210 [Coniosporium apollinis CBS 100218]EON69945.1 hypothetical protein W97_09210 [Coniosporium apollinis CBS 100218]
MSSLAPFKNSMRLGMGFNSYTQNVCVDDAVIITSTVTIEEKQNGSQNVTYVSDFIDKFSDITDSMNISGSVEIKYGPIAGGGKGSYLDVDKFKESDINFMIKVDVVNQTIETDKRTTKFNRIPNSKPANFNAVYGDSFISGWQEGGVFHGIVSMKVLDKSKLTEIKADAHVALEVGAGSVKANAAVELAKSNLTKNTEITIWVNWSGGGQIKKEEELWTIDSLTAAAARFPALVAKTPQYTHAIVTKYTALRSFHVTFGDISPLSYENAAAFTNLFFVEYRQLFKELTRVLEGVSHEKIEFVPTDAARRLPDAFEASMEGLLEARSDAFAQMNAINTLVDQIEMNPAIVKTFNKKNPAPYVDPVHWKLRIPKTRPVATSQGKPVPILPLKGGLEFFARGADGGLWHKAVVADHESATEGPGMWNYHGDSILLNSACDPACAISATEDKIQLDVFVVGADSKLYEKHQANNDQWTSLNLLEPAKDLYFTSVAVLDGQDRGGDRLDLCAIGVTGKMYWVSRQAGKWSMMQQLGDARFIGTPTMVLNRGNASLNIFAVTTEYDMAFNLLPSGTESWRTWSVLPATWVRPDTYFAAVWAQAGGDFTTQLDVFTIGSGEGSLWESQCVNDQWRDGTGSHLSLNKSQARSSIAAISLGPGREELFVVAEKGALYQSTWNRDAGTSFENSWKKIADGPFRSTPVVVKPGNHLEAYVVDASGKLVQLVLTEDGWGSANRV